MIPQNHSMPNFGHIDQKSFSQRMQERLMQNFHEPHLMPQMRPSTLGSSVFRKAHLGSSHNPDKQSNIWGCSSALSDAAMPIDGSGQPQDETLDRQIDDCNDFYSNSMLDDEDSQDEFEVRQALNKDKGLSLRSFLTKNNLDELVPLLERVSGEVYSLRDLRQLGD